MDGSNLSISALKDKVSSKLSSEKSSEGPKKSGKEEKAFSSKAIKKDKGKPKLKENISVKLGKRDKKDTPTKDDKKAKNVKKEKKPTQSTKVATDTDSLLALGATEEDLKLVADLDDDTENIEISSSAKPDNALNSDVSNFMSDLGLSGLTEKVERKSSQKVGKEGSSKSEKKKKSELKLEKSDRKKSEEKVQKQEKKKSRQNKDLPVETEEDPHESTVVVSEMTNKKREERPKSDRQDDFRSVNPEKLRMECRLDWYNIEKTPVEESEKLDRFALERLTDKAKAFVDAENKAYLGEFTANNSQKRFLSQILSDGTLNDKISALTLLIQEAPFHNLKAFDTLLYYCEKKSRTASMQAIDALKDLFLNGLLPDRKLLSFAKQPLNKNLDEKTLALYYFEDHLKKSYFKFIQVLEYLSHDPILHVRMNVVLHIFDLLKAKPEQEANLLRLGVNKLGDIENKVSAKTSFQVLQLEEAHPAMKKIITDAVTDMVLQKKNDYHSQYYTILTLNQTILLKTDIDLANSLVKTYFSLFEKILIEADPALKEKVEDKVLGKSENGRKNNRKSSKKGKKGGKSVKVAEKTEEEVVEERSAKMFSALLTGLNRAFPFADLPSEIYSSHLNTLYKITHSTNFNTSVQALVLVHQIVTQQDLDTSRYYRTLYESLLDPRLVNSSKQGIYLNLLFKSLKHDIQNIPRVLAFVKRILQICCHWINVGAITGMIFLLMELSKTHPQILELMEAEAARPESHTVVAADDEKNTQDYDPKKRDPEYANAQKSCMWEMALFVNHYHPSVSIYATSLIEGKPQPKPDLGLFSLAHFLDRFVYKNAKQKTNLKGSSIMQPLGGGHLGLLLVKATGVQSSEMPMNTIDWLSKKAELVRPDEKFFYEYFVRNENKIRTQKTKENNGEEDEELEEDQVWDALIQLKPEVEGLDEDDFSDFDEDVFDDMSDDESDQADADANASLIEDDLEEFEELQDEGEDDGAEESGDGASDDEASLGQLQNEDDEITDGELEGTNEDDEEVSKESKKRKLENDDRKKKKAKLWGLPTFASAEDYAEYLLSDDDM